MLADTQSQVLLLLSLAISQQNWFLCHRFPATLGHSAVLEALLSSFPLFCSFPDPLQLSPISAYILWLLTILRVIFPISCSLLPLPPYCSLNLGTVLWFLWSYWTLRITLNFLTIFAFSISSGFSPLRGYNLIPLFPSPSFYLMILSDFCFFVFIFFVLEIEARDALPLSTSPVLFIFEKRLLIALKTHVLPCSLTITTSPVSKTVL